LVSNFSLVMGVAGAATEADFVLLAGIAGLLAGAFSMAAGEYVSMRSQRDLYEHQIRQQEARLDESPENAEEDLVLIYEAKGLPTGVAEGISKQIIKRPQVALDTMVREGLGLDPMQLGSPWGASVSSFIAFVVGALVPILPYVFDAGSASFVLSGVLSAVALAVVGAVLGRVTERNYAWCGLRMLLAGGAAAAVTFGIGHLVGMSILG
jgi:VIT1/CCC1 family predicted Fe2+/Mn2+ transporter